VDWRAEAAEAAGTAAAGRVVQATTDAVASATAMQRWRRADPEGVTRSVSGRREVRGRRAGADAKLMVTGGGDKRCDKRCNKRYDNRCNERCNEQRSKQRRQSTTATTNHNDRRERRGR